MIDLPVLMRHVAERADGAASGRRIDVDVDGCLLALVDGPMIERILENLVGNAAKHTPPGTKITVAALADGDDVLVSVSDDGPGVPEALRESIFQPFHRGPTAPAHSPGSGIGLSLVARFADLHGGKAWVEDRPDGGASFQVRLPGAVVRTEPSGLPVPA